MTNEWPPKDPEAIDSLSINQKLEILNIDSFESLFLILEEEFRDFLFEKILKQYPYEDVVLMLTDRQFFVENLAKVDPKNKYELNRSLKEQYFSEFKIQY